MPKSAIHDAQPRSAPETNRRCRVAVKIARSTANSKERSFRRSSSTSSMPSSCHSLPNSSGPPMRFADSEKASSLSRAEISKVLEQNVDTSTSAGRAFFGMLAVFAAFETDVRRERKAEGIAKAKRAGIYKGGVKRIDRTRVRALNSSGSGPSAIAHEMGMSRRQVYRILGENV